MNAHTLNSIDTIAAIATPPGKGGVGIIRISGPDAFSISETILKKPLKPRYADYGPFYDGQDNVLDIGIALFFKSPHSFTGEDVIELQAHGGPIILDNILKAVVALGARVARPGEFSERAFLNNKIDLTQAEAIADLINANSEQAARSAMQSLQGDFSKKIHEFLDELIYLRKYIEAAIDFPDEEIDFISDGKIEAMLINLIDKLKQILNSVSQGVILREGVSVVLCGKPNSGKSTLLNALSGAERAIVTDIAGTTRDVMREEIMMDGLPLHIIDTAGLRDSDDVVEQEGVRRAKLEIEKADVALFIKDINDVAENAEERAITEQHPNLNVIRVFNKIDTQTLSPQVSEDGSIYISAKENQGLELLSHAIKQLVGLNDNSEGLFIARRRHLDALTRAHTALVTALEHIQVTLAGELAAEECKTAQNALSEITGEFSSDDLLGEIFTSFCIGK